MADYRAKPEQWQNLERAVEPKATPWIVSDETACLLELRARVEALEDATWQQEVRWNAKPTPNDRQIRSSLVKRVEKALRQTPEAFGWETEARAAIREVAAWLRDTHGREQIPNLLDKEAER